MKWLAVIALMLSACVSRRMPVAVELVADEFDLRWVWVDVGGHRLRALLDTGATDHLMSARVYREVFGREARGTPLRLMGFSGEATRAVVVPGVRAQLQGVGVALDGLVVSNLADEALILSVPQLAKLFPIELDLVSSRLWLRAELERDFGALAATTCRPIPGNPDLSWTVAVKVDGMPVTLLVDTGAEFVSLSSEEPAAASLLPRSVAAGRVGSKLGAWPSRRVDARVSFAGIETNAAVRLVPDHLRTCGAGVLGMPVLRRCRLQLSGAKARIACSSDARPADDK